MKRETMKQNNTSIKTVVFGLVLLLMGMGGAYAAMPCEGTVYFKIPSTWTSAYTVAGGQKTAFTPSTYTGWSQVSTSAIGGANAANEFFIEQTGANDCNSAKCVRRDSMDVMYLNFATGRGFKCTDFGTTGELWISPNPDPAYPNVPYFNSVAPDVKFFYVFLPDEAVWKSAVPMMSSDGGPGEALTADPDRCGWYFKRYIDEPLPSSVVIYRDDDPTQAEAIGLNGIWDEDGVADPIPLVTYFTLYSASTLYFVADDSYWDAALEAEQGWSITDPTAVESSCTYNLAAMIYDTDASLHGAFTCVPDWVQGQTPAQAAVNACYYPTAPYNVASSATGQVPCIGVTPGIVDPILGADNKPVYNNASGCFPNGGFTELFNSTPNVNETYCFDLPFSRSDDGQWEFNSDTYQSPGASVPGGFYPAETTPTATLVSAALPAAETKRKAEGPVFLCKGLRALDPTENVPVIDVFCKGPGYNSVNAENCAGLFKGGSEFTAALYPQLGLINDADGWGWSCPNDAPIGWPKYLKGTETPSAATSAENRWTSGVADNTPTGALGRNQHFCFESHASFTYKPGLRFSFRGDDDIWVFIGGKLAVDLGGTHLAAPGYVKLEEITDKSGNPLVVGTTYPIDIFFCDRRTTMSNVRIKTNMYIQQKTGITYVPDNSEPGVKKYKLCWNESGDGSCAAAMGGTSGSVELCGQDIITANKTIDYTLTRRDGSVVPKGDVADLAAAGVYFGGIDLTNRHTAAINVEHMQGLSPGTYKLVMGIGNKSTYVTFRVSGSVDVVVRDAIDPAVSPSPTWKFVSSAMAGTKIPIYVSSVADPGTGNLELDLEGAVGQAYSLTTSSNLNLYADSASDAILAPTDFPRSIGASGVDTLWATVPLAAMTASTEAHTVQVTGRPSAAALTFYAPKIIFADAAGTQITTLADTMWVGSAYNVRLVAINPLTSAVCSDCNFAVNSGSQTSNKVETIPATIDVVNGEATVTFRSLTEYIDVPATLSLVGPNAALLSATLSPLYFKDPPVPFPVLVEIYDKHGAPSAKTLAIPTPYFSTSQEYLDGIADSLVVHYHRSFHKDSLPDSVFVKWDLKAENGGVLDSIKLDKNQIMAGTNCNGDLCDSILRFGGIEFSKGIQTVGSPNTILSSWATYLDKTRPVSLASQAIITDRIAPILLKGRVSNVKGSAGFDRVALLASEPVLIKNSTVSASYGLSAFTYYLKSATEVGNTADAKYLNVIANSGDLSAARDTVMMLYNNTDNLKPSPRAGDYVRFRADIAELISDVGGNFPTNYDAEVASPWAPIEGDAKSEVLSIPLNSPDPDKIKDDMKDGKVVEIFPVDIYDSKDTVKAKYPNTLGHIVKTDIGNILTSAEFADVDPKGVSLVIETQYFTNLGSFVAGSSYTISCIDPFFNASYPEDKTTVGDCRQNPKYVYVAWNMLSQDNRMVGTGAYISKVSTYVTIPGHGTTGKHDLTEMWGVKRGGNIFK